jgi:signal transduction histidine kinase
MDSINGILKLFGVWAIGLRCRMIKKNITFKLTIGFLLIVVVSTLFIGIIASNMFNNNIYEVKKSNMQKHATAISETISPYINNVSNTEELIKTIDLINNIDNAEVWVLDNQGQIINNSDKDKQFDDQKVSEQYRDIIKKALEGAESYDQIYNPNSNQDMMIVAVPIKDGNNVIGAIVLNSSIVDLVNSMNKFFYILTFIVFGEIILVGFLGYYFSKSISMPLKKINISALELARGHYGIKTNIYQRDEIGELSSSFDLLSLKLEYTIKKLFEERDKLKNIITSISEGILALDTSYGIININKASKELLLDKASEEDIEIIKILNELAIINEFNSAIQNDQKKSIIKEHNGKILDFSISPIKNNLDEIIGGVILIQDISEKEKLEQMRKDFISNVSHEFRTPLTVIKGNLESIVDGMTKPENINETAVTLIKEVNRLERMVRDLLNLSRLDSGKLELNFDMLDINMLINDTIRSLKPLLNRKEIELDLSLQKDLPIILNDYDKLKQLIIIFLDNAIKFSEIQGEIVISTYSEVNKIFIAIKDNAIGIPKDELKYLGEKFYKADKARKSNIEGTGLGLSIAKRLVKALNGEFSVESYLGKGTTITISFLINK